MSSDYIANSQGENFPQFLPLEEVRFENNFSLLLDFYLVRPHKLSPSFSLSSEVRNIRHFKKGMLIKFCDYFSDSR